MENCTNERQETMEKIARQVLTAAPVFKKKLFRPDIEQKDNPIPLSYVQVLAALEEAGRLSVSEISARFDIAKPNITPLIDRMINAGYVTRERNAADRRVVHVVILDKGREKVRDTVEALRVCMESWAKELDAGKLETLSDALETIRLLLGNE